MMPSQDVRSLRFDESLEHFWELVPSRDELITWARRTLSDGPEYDAYAESWQHHVDRAMHVTGAGLFLEALVPRPGINRDDALAHVVAIAASARIAHEHKLWAIALLVADWFEPTVDVIERARRQTLECISSKERPWGQKPTGL